LPLNGYGSTWRIFFSVPEFQIQKGLEQGADVTLRRGGFAGTQL
jgi:hypothetical protein